jgi:hypothetical protein
MFKPRHYRAEAVLAKTSNDSKQRRKFQKLEHEIRSPRG